MVARSPPKQKKVLPPLNPLLIRETLNKVDRCMARLHELHHTVTAGTTRGYLKTSLRVKNGATSKSPKGKFPFPANTGEWRVMSLPAMLLGETVGEILQASQFAREIVSAAGMKTSTEDPKTPLSQRTNLKACHENTQLKARRKKEKQTKLQYEDSPTLQRARSRINFKVSPPKVREFDKENSKYIANRVSPKNRPWARKTVLFPNPLFLSTQSSQQKQFWKTRSPIISKNKGTPHKFLVKSPPSTSKFQVKIKKSPPTVSISPTRPTTSLSKSSQKRLAAASKFHIFHPPVVSISPKRPASLSISSPKRSAASKFRRSFSPSRLANRLISPLRGKKSVQKSDVLVSGLKQRPTSAVQFPLPRT
ncbi:hypothetical protein TanjilG_15591 [Lupinus angustifolius]|uniref:microtubule-binding protein TANGLED-like n=1 Tax=Lupinus angustifolius TaxID=3871 RepID=UPI00090DDFB9|nr:PREDICTED: microtubule-binding protein TANGLED-like [Lupinus angustifolius]OIV90858.1 hypothetical protein TanjilG_15591 [Lupinus angustifolius]